jgi:hypothetical protein
MNSLSVRIYLNSHTISSRQVNKCTPNIFASSIVLDQEKLTSFICNRYNSRGRKDKTAADPFSHDWSRHSSPEWVIYQSHSTAFIQPNIVVYMNSCVGNSMAKSNLFGRDIRGTVSIPNVGRLYHPDLSPQSLEIHFLSTSFDHTKSQYAFCYFRNSSVFLRP